jgi:hypothetical protein
MGGADNEAEERAVSLGPNALEPCGTPTAKKRHAALAEFCATCGTYGRRVPLPTLSDIVDDYRRRAGVLRDVS